MVWYGGEFMDIKIAIKELAYFVCQSGDLTTELFSMKELEEGTRLHKFIQSKYNEQSKSEVYIKKQLNYKGKELFLHGFIDGVLQVDEEIIIEEIKSTAMDFTDLTPRPEHLAQLKIYGYLYAIEHSLNPIHIRLTYISVVDYEIKSIDYIMNLDALESFFFDVIEQYMEWVLLNEEATNLKDQTIQMIKFPYKQMRPGQRDMMKACFQTMKQKDILYTIAPTGIGKTMAALFSSLKTLKKNDKLFYLTAKGSGKKAPLSAIKLLARQGLRVKTINLIAKKKICNAKAKNCNPEECEYAKNYFDKKRKALSEIFQSYDIYDEEIIQTLCEKYKLCAFEFSLDLSYYCDIILADYNYVFDPRAHLIRYFEDDTYHPKVLVDEAHNLISRSKEMYSAILQESDIKAIRRLLNGYEPSIRKECNIFLEKLNECKDLLAKKTIHVEQSIHKEWITILKNILTKCDSILADNKKIKNKDEVLEVYFKIYEFVEISTYFGPNHRFIMKLEEEECILQLYCLDASAFLLETIKESIEGIVFFSATLLPFQYHADLLTQGEGKFLELPSPFDSNHLDIIINNKISTKYNDRQNSIDSILETIEILTETKKGNYIIFFPSYQYLNLVVEYIQNPEYEMIIQKTDTTETERTEIIQRFKDTSNTKVGFFVLGGVFSEGIDFIGDWLTGVIIVGVGLPMYCDENNLLKEYFDEIYQTGFDYAYTYPGFTKVVQAAGRVIRSEEDRGVVILLDNRFTQLRYQQIMPKHWTNKKIITNAYHLKKELKDFYQNNK